MSVGPTRGPVERPGLERDLTEIFQRLDDLERFMAAVGWRFNIFNGETSPTGFGWVEATESVDHGFGQLGMLLGEKTGDGTQVYSRNPGNTKIGAFFTTPDVMILSLSSSMSIHIDRAAGTISLNGPSSTIMRLDSDETVHIQSGQTIIADL